MRNAIDFLSRSCLQAAAASSKRSSETQHGATPKWPQDVDELSVGVKDALEIAFDKAQVSSSVLVLIIKKLETKTIISKKTKRPAVSL